MTIALCTASLCPYTGDSINLGSGWTCPLPDSGSHQPYWHIQLVGGQQQELAPDTHSVLNHHLLQVFADVGKHWPLVRFLLPTLQHQIIPVGSTCGWSRLSSSCRISATTPHSALGPGSSVPKLQSVSASLVSFSELGQGLRGPWELGVPGAVVQHPVSFPSLE